MLPCVLAFLFYFAALVDRDECWSDDPQTITPLFNRQIAFDCEWCGPAEGQAAYLLTPRDVRADSRICVFGDRPDASDPDALVAPQIMLGHEARPYQRERYRDAGRRVVLLRSREGDSVAALIHSKRFGLVLPNPPATRCYRSDAVALVSRQLPNREFEIVTRDKP